VPTASIPLVLAACSQKVRRPDRVVLPRPGFDQNPSLVLRVENLSVEELIALASVSYRGMDWVRNDAEGFTDDVPMAGDRAPDTMALARAGVGFPLRLFDVLRCTAYVLVIRLATAPTEMTALVDFAAELRSWLGGCLRIVVVTAAEKLPDCPGLVFFHDHQGNFSTSYGAEDVQGVHSLHCLSCPYARITQHRVDRPLGRPLDLAAGP
jgi:hypothetical protein